MIDWKHISEYNDDVAGWLCLVEQPSGNPLIEIACPLIGSENGVIVGIAELDSMPEARASIGSLKAQHNTSELSVQAHTPTGERIALIAIDKLQAGLNNLITACGKKGGASRKDIAHARALLSPKHSNSFEIKNE